MPKHLALAAVLAVLPSLAEAQHSDHIAVRPSLLTFFEAEPHAGAAVTLRRNLWGNWGLNGGYILAKSLTGEPNWGNLAWAGFEYSFGPPDDVEPYVLLGSVVAFIDGGSVGFYPLPGAGAGVRYWHHDQTWFVAPEASFGVNSQMTFSIGFGFGL